MSPMTATTAIPTYDVRGPHRPSVCPLAQAVGAADLCSRATCPFYRVPGTYRECAVEQWAPGVRRDHRTARWFIARKAEILRGRGVPSPPR
jgi:hypothetical protein